MRILDLTLRRAALVAAATCVMGTVLIGTSGAAFASSAPATAAPTAETLIVSAPGWAIYAQAALPNVKPVVITASTSPETAASLISRGSGSNCGIVTCTLYIYRGTTRTIDAHVSRYANASAAAIAGAFALACLPLGGVSATVCAAAGAVIGGYAIDQFNYARAHNECIAIKFLASPILTPIGIAPNNSGFCHN